MIVSDEVRLQALDFLRIANEAVAQAIAENEALGIPEFFWKAGKIYYVTPDGELTTEVPEILRPSAPADGASHAPPQSPPAPDR
jgi:predicted metal-dependent phosphotriesterase family hydrolase